MSLDDYITRVPDDDPEGESVDRDICPDCGAGPDGPCKPGCECVYCQRRKALAVKDET